MAKLTYPILDSSAFIQYNKKITATLGDKMTISMVVLYELTATTIDREYLQKVDRLRQSALKRGRLITPTMTDWWETAKMIRRLRFGEKSTAGGKTPKIPDASRMQNDALIARNASLNNCYVVTTNIEDFNKFVPFMNNPEVVSAEDFFA